MGHGITKLKNNDLDVSAYEEQKATVVTKRKEKSKLAEELEWKKFDRYLQQLKINEKPTVQTQPHRKHTRKLPPLQLSLTEKQKLPEVKGDFDKGMKRLEPVGKEISQRERLGAVGGEVSQSQNEIKNFETIRRTVYPNSDEISKTNRVGQSGKTRPQSPIMSMRVQTTPLTNTYDGDTLSAIVVDERVDGLHLKRKQTNEIEIQEQYSKHAQQERKSETVQQHFHFDIFPKELQNPGIDMCTYLMQLKQSQEDVGPFMTWFYSLAKKSIQFAETIWLGYETEISSKPVIVAIYKDTIPEYPKQLNNFNIIKRKKNQVSKEGIDIIRIEQARGMKFSSKEQQRVQQCLTKFSSSLMIHHSNLNIVSASKIKSKYYCATKEAKHVDQTCITLYVQIKGVIPFFEESFPVELDGFPVDVREGTFHTFGKQPDDYHQNLMMGCQIVSAYNQAGTLGGFVQLQNGNIGCLTCCHLFQTDESVLDYHKDRFGLLYFKKDVFQPNLEPCNKFGDLAKFLRTEGDSENIGVDMALIEITDPMRYPTTGCFPKAELEEAGFSAENPMVYTSGEIVKGFDEIPPLPCTVVKYGIGTEHTIGILRLQGCAVHRHSTNFFPNDSIRLHQQLEVFSIKDRPFANQGDSGALVFLVSKDKTEIKLKALGLLVGGTDNGTTIVTPLWAILEQLDLPLSLLSFDGLSRAADLSRKDNDRLERIERDVENLKTGVSTLYSRLEENTQTTQRTEQNIVFMDKKIEEIRTTVANKQDIEAILQLLSKK